MRVLLATTFVLFSWIGWGGLLARLLRADLVWPEKAVLGVSAIILLGGPLDLARAISPQLIYGLTAAGCAAYAMLSWEGRSTARMRDPLDLRDRPDARARTVRWVILAGLVFFAAGTASLTRQHNDHDDYTAYAAFTQKMLQTGHLGEEPYSERRIVSALGGKSWLDAFAVVLLGYGRTRALDAGLGWACLIGLLSYWGARRGLGPRTIVSALAVCWTTLLLCSNTTAWMLPAALMLYLLIRTTDDPAVRQGPGERVALACVIAAVCALKSNLIPPVVLYVGGMMLVSASRGERGRAAGLALTAVLAVILIAPWSMVHYRDCATFLFPLLGRGYHLTAYAFGSAARWEPDGAYALVVVRDLLSNKLLLLAVLGCALSALARVRLSRPTVVMAAAVSATALVMTFGTAGWDNLHYTYSALTVLIAAIVFDGAAHLSALYVRDPRRREPLTRRAWACSILYVLCLVVTLSALTSSRGWCSTLYQVCRSMYASTKSALLGSALPQPVAMDAQVWHQYAQAQRWTAAGEPILLSADAAYAMDFKRNPIYLADFPGSAGPAPGMPLDEGVQAWVEYLRGRGIRYVAMDRKGVFSKQALTFMLRWRGYEGRKWIERQMSDALKYEALFTSACERLPRYDKGRLWVVDLSGGVAA